MSHAPYQIVTQDPAMRDLIASAEGMAPLDSTVLITGPTGSGKELTAHHIHAHSGRKGPFWAINCSAVPPSLLAPELFGHEKGVYTDAREARPGYFERADRGTLFLDEIQTMDPLMQRMLLRVLEDKRVRRIGAKSEVVVDVRVLGGTNIDLERAVEEERFPGDLYERLAVLKLRVPPLVDRRGDIPGLVHHFIRQHARECQIPEPQITDDAMWLLQSYPWPRNVRELKNAVAQLVTACGESPVDARCVLSVVQALGDVPVVPHRQCRAQQFVRALMKKRWRMDVVAEWLGVHPRTVRRTIAGIDADAYADQLIPGDPRVWEQEERANIHRALHAAGGNVRLAAELLEISQAALRKLLAADAKRKQETCPANGQTLTQASVGVSVGVTYFAWSA